VRTFFYIPLVAVLLVALCGAVRAATDEDLATLEAKRLQKTMETIAVLRAKGDVAGMLSHYREGLAISPSDETVRTSYIELGTSLTGYALTHKADPAQVLELLDDLEAYVGEKFETLPSLWWMRVATLRRLGRTDEADALAQKALDYKGDDADYHRRLGLLLMEVGLYEEALIELEAALAVADNDWLRGLCRWAIAASRLNLEQYEAAADEYERAVAVFRQSTQPHNYETLLEHASTAFTELGRYYELRGRHADTIAANERALKLLPDELDEDLQAIAAPNLVAIGEAYLRLDKPKDALERLERARELDPDSPGIHIALGDAYTKLDDDEKASEAYKRCEALYRARIERWPDSPHAYNNLAWFLVTHDMKLDEALKLSRTSLEIAPDTDAYLDTLAEIYHRMGDNDKAIEWITKAIELDPKPRHILYFEQQLEKFQKAKEKSD